jgi:hypothetical protein
MNMKHSMQAIFIICALSYANLSVAENCAGHVKFVSSDFEEQNLTLKVRVFADKKMTSRTVYYTIFGEYDTEMPGALGLPSLTVKASLNSSNSTVVGAGDEWKNQEIRVSAPSRPLSAPKIKNILVDACYTQ